MSSPALAVQPLTACDRRRGFAFVASLLSTFGLHVLLVLHVAPLLQRACEMTNYEFPNQRIN